MISFFKPGRQNQNEHLYKRYDKNHSLLLNRNLLDTRLQVKTAITLTHISSARATVTYQVPYIENFLKFRRIEVRVDLFRKILGF